MTGGALPVASVWDGALVDVAPFGLARVDASGAVVAANAPLLQLLGGEDVARCLWDAVIRPRLIEILRAGESPEVGIKAPIRLVLPDGAVRYVDPRVSILDDGGALVSVADISLAVEQHAQVTQSEAAYRDLADHVADAMITIVEHRVSWASPACRWVLGYEPHALVGMDLQHLLCDDGGPGPVRLAGDRSVTVYRTRLRTSSGACRWFEVRLSGNVTWESLPATAYALVHDVHEEMELTRRVDRLQASTRAVLDAVRGVLMTGDGTAILAAAETITGALVSCLLQPDNHGDLVVTVSQQPDLVGMRVPLSVPTAGALCFQQATPVWMDDVTGDERVSPAVLRRVNQLLGAEMASAACYPVLHMGRCLAVLVVVCGPDVEPPHSHETALELLANEAALALHLQSLLRELERLATLDPLTEVPNRRSWEFSLGRELPRAAREGVPVSILMIDIDHFKAYNDAHGHTAGDNVLRSAAAAWQGRLRPGDVLCRWGGEEFVLLLPNCTADGAGTVAHDLRRLMPGGATCSIGVAEWDRHESSEQLIKRADQALYAAKADGRNCVRSAART